MTRRSRPSKRAARGGTLKKARGARQRLCSSWRATDTRTSFWRSTDLVTSACLVEGSGLERMVSFLLLFERFFFVLRLRPLTRRKNARKKTPQKTKKTDIDALKRKLTKQLSPEDSSLAHAWEVGEVVGTWWRTGWDAALYPYVPAHVTRPKEALRLFFVALPEQGFFGVPRDRRLVAVPLFELHDNPGRYGPLLAALPAMLSRFRINVVAAAAPVGGGGAAGGGGGPEAFDPYAS